MKRLILLVYGLVCYVISLWTLLYTIGFLTNLFVRKSIDAPGTSGFSQAFFTNLCLLLLFAVQHSGMARPCFKRWFTQWIPSAAERSTYLLFSCAALLLLCKAWQPMPGMIWQVNNPVALFALWAVNATGWVTIVLATFFIDHFEMFGLRQVWSGWQSKPNTPPQFTTPGLYRWVRHPLYLGWLTVFWATPTMSSARLMFASILTVYILVAIRWEEKDLAESFGTTYKQYQRRVPMLLPRPRKTNVS